MRVAFRNCWSIDEARSRNAGFSYHLRCFLPQAKQSCGVLIPSRPTLLSLDHGVPGEGPAHKPGARPVVLVDPGEEFRTSSLRSSRPVFWSLPADPEVRCANKSRLPISTHLLPCAARTFTKAKPTRLRPRHRRGSDRRQHRTLSGNERGLRFARPPIPGGGGGTPHRNRSAKIVRSVCLWPKAAELGDAVGRPAIGYTGRAARVVGRAALDPKPTLGQCPSAGALAGAWR
jgi:hypothetical protein